MTDHHALGAMFASKFVEVARAQPEYWRAVDPAIRRLQNPRHSYRGRDDTEIGNATLSRIAVATGHSTWGQLEKFITGEEPRRYWGVEVWEIADGFLSRFHYAARIAAPPSPRHVY